MNDVDAEVKTWLEFAVGRVVEFLNESGLTPDSGAVVLFSGRKGEFNKRGAELWQQHHALVAAELRVKGYTVEVIPVSNALRISRNK